MDADPPGRVSVRVGRVRQIQMSVRRNISDTDHLDADPPGRVKARDRDTSDTFDRVNPIDIPEPRERGELPISQPTQFYNILGI